jgi:two-component system, cell cycle sensor histidine kinase and response regulator CckA
MTARPELVARQPTVLVVDDEPTVRAVVRRTLASDGYRVLEAASGPAALELTAAHEGTVDLLILDLDLLGMRGEELAGRILSLHPRTPVLFISGRADWLRPEMLAAPLLGKPFTPDILSGTVRALLGRGR